MHIRFLAIEKSRTSAGRTGALCLIAFAALFVLVACSRQENAGDVVVFRHGKMFGDPAPFAALLAEFERRNPGIRVRDETLPSSSDEQHQFYAINLQAKSDAFDVLAADVIWVAEFAHAGWVRDLSRLLLPAQRKAFFDGPMEAVTHEGRVYAIPWYVDAGLLYYRRDLLDKHGRGVPRTWSELVHTAQAITAAEPGLRGFVWQGKQYEGLVCNALEFLWSNGGGVWEQGRVRLDTSANREALGFMAALIHQWRVSPASVTTATEEPSRHLFGRGEALFLRNWPYAWHLFQQEGSAVRGRVGVSVLPHFAGSASAATLGGWQLAVNRHSRRPEAAEKLVAFLTSPHAQKALALAYGFQPARRALYRDAQLLARQPFLAELEPIFASARPRPVTPHYVRISQELQAAFSAVISGLDAPGPALAQAQSRIEEILADAR